MHPSVRDIFYGFNAPLEGVTTFLYLDILGYVTTGVGNLCPRSLAVTLPFKRADGSVASPQEIGQAWDVVHALRKAVDDKGVPLVKKGGFHFARYTTLRLTDDGVRSLVSRKLAEVDAQLAKALEHYERWPADAQLAALSMAWAMGAGFVKRFPKWKAAVDRGDFREAAEQCSISSKGNPGVVPRNTLNKQLLLNAADVIEQGLCPSELVWSL